MGKKHLEFCADFRSESDFKTLDPENVVFFGGGGENYRFF
jgi:hypothetical protein